MLSLKFLLLKQKNIGKNINNKFRNSLVYLVYMRLFFFRLSHGGMIEIEIMRVLPAGAGCVSFCKKIFGGFNMVYFSNFKGIDYGKYDEVWLIVRSIKQLPNNPKVRWVPELSPSSGLFYEYLDLKKAGKWNYDSFREIRNPEGLKKLNELFRVGREKDILCVCFCEHEELCHRSIVKGLLQGAEAQYNVECVGGEGDYGVYFEMYNAMKCVQ